MRGTRHATATFLLVLLAALAGCAGEVPDDAQEGAGGDADGADGTAPFQEPVPLPVGRWWRYTTSFGGQADAIELVVTEDAGTAYVTGTTTRSLAAFHAEEEVSYLGPLGKSHLSGSQDGRDVFYFRFPLEADKTWTTQWDGVDREVRVVSLDGDARVALEASESGSPQVRYSYDNASGLFGNLDFLGPDGQVAFGMTLDDWGDNFTGTLVEASVELLVSNTGGPGPDAITFSVADGTEELVLRYGVNCTASAVGHWEVAFTPRDSDAPQDDGHRASGDCPMDEDFEVVLAAPVAGTWEYTAVWGAEPGGTTTQSVRVLARSYTETPFPG